MIATGIVRRIDDLGRVAIPKEILSKINIKVGDPIEFFLEDDKICFRLYYSGYKYDIASLIEGISDDDYATYDKNKVIELLKKAEKLII